MMPDRSDARQRSRHSRRATPVRRSSNGPQSSLCDSEQPTPGERHTAMNWTQRLSRVFYTDMETAAP